MVFDHKTAQEKIVPEPASRPPAAGERPATEALAGEQSSSALGLDVGTSRIVVARGVGSHARFESQLNAFVKIPYSKMTIGVLCKEQIPHAVKGDQIIVEGNESARFAGLLDAEMQRPMTCGVLDASHADSLQVIRELLMSILGHADAFSERKVTFTVPAPPLGAEGSLTFHQKTLTQIIQDLGYETSCINEGLAVVYSELENSNYTGIGVSCGGGLCNVCLSYLSVPVLSFSVPKAGDFIDANAANVTGERANRIRLTKEDSFHFNGYFPDKTHQVISVYYEEVIQTLVASLKQAFARTATLPKFDRPIPLVLSGGTALPPGFRDRFEKLLREQDFPITVSEIRVAKDPLHATAKGALVFALSDE